MVAGAAALLWSHKPQASVQEIRCAAESGRMQCPHCAVQRWLARCKTPLLADRAQRAPRLLRSTALLSSVDRSPGLEGRVASGGRLNVAQAVAALYGISAPAPRVAFSADLTLVPDTGFSFKLSSNTSFFEVTNDFGTVQGCR